jgi:hypothetical protein
MKNSFAVVLLLAVATVIDLPSPAYAIWSKIDTDKVPIERLVTNLEEFEAKLPANHKIDRARVEFQIGRLYSMAYARNTETADVRKPQARTWQSKPDPLESRLEARIAKSWQNKMGQTLSGIVVDACVRLNGNQLLEIKICKSSGDDSLDKAALAVVAAAARDEHLEKVNIPRSDWSAWTVYRIRFDDFIDNGRLTEEMPAHLTPYYGFGIDTFHHLFDEEALAERPKMAYAMASLTKAIAHLQTAVELNPNLRLAKLGLAWCVEQSGDRRKATDIYRAVFESSYKIEVRSTFECFEPALTEESGMHLLELLDEKTDSSEIANIKSKMRQIQVPYCFTPLLVPLTPASNLNALVQPSRVKFDLDGQGSRACLTWITPRAGWLVFDKTDSGVINSGKQLIGAITFWVFWKNGYEVLSALDDNHDGILSGAELDHLAVWNDVNGDGISQPGEVRPLSFWNITGLSCKYIQENGHLLTSKDGVVFEDGTHRPSYDVWIELEP